MASQYGIYSSLHYIAAPTASPTTFLYGIAADVNIDNLVSTTSDITTVHGLFSRLFNLSSSCTVTNYIGVRTGAASGTITNAYGLWIENVTAGATNNYAIYSLGGNSYHAGSFGIGTSAANSPLHVAGAVATAVATKVPGGNPNNLTGTDSVVLCNAASGATTVTLPSAVNITGRQYFIKKIDSSANAVTIGTSSSQTVDGAAPAGLATQWSSLRVVSNGANWIIC